MIMQNLHTHCDWDHGENTMEDIILAAKNKKLSSVGISVHAPMNTFWCCPLERMEYYKAEALALKEEYKGKIDVYVGVEWDIYSTMKQEDLAGFDYVIGSAHMIRVPSKLPENCPPELAALFPTHDVDIHEEPNTTKHMIQGYFDGDANKAAEAYFAQYKQIADNKHVQIVGHFDLIAKFNEITRDAEYPHFDEEGGVYLAAAEKAMDQLIAAGKIFEVNTGRGMESAPYPSRTLLKMLKEKGGKVTVGSDAHRAEDIACGFAKAEKLLRECGFKEIWELGPDGFAVKPL